MIIRYLTPTGYQVAAQEFKSSATASSWLAGALHTDTGDDDSRYMISHTGNSVPFWIDDLGGVQEAGTKTDDDAQPGFKGECREFKLYDASGASLSGYISSEQFGEFGYVDLTGGNWEIVATGGIWDSGATSFTAFGIGISTTLGNSNAGLLYGDTFAMTQQTGILQTALCVNVKVKVAAGATPRYYLKCYGVWSGTSPKTYGAKISALRIR